MDWYHKRSLWDSVIITGDDTELHAVSRPRWPTAIEHLNQKQQLTGDSSGPVSRVVISSIRSCATCANLTKLRGITGKDPTLMRIWMDPVAFADMKYQKLMVQAVLDSGHTALLRWASSPRRPTGVASRYKKCPRNKDRIQTGQI